MKEEILRDFYGRVIGYIETYPNGDQQIRDFYRKVLGKYDHATNTTKDFYGKIVAKGNCITMLLKK